MMRVDMMQLESDYEIAQNLMKNHKYVQAVVHLEKLLKQTFDDTSKDIFKNLYRDIIFAYRAINNKTRADYYYTKAIGLFGEIEESSVNKEINTENSVQDEIEISAEETIEEAEITEEIIENTSEITVEEPKMQEEIILKNEVELGEDIVFRTANDFEILKTAFKIKANEPNETNFNNIFVEISATLESKKYFGYFKLNLNKLNDCLNKGINSLEKERFLKLKWEVKTLLNLIEQNGVSSFESLYKLEFEEFFDAASIIEEQKEEFEPNIVSFETKGTFTFKQEEREFNLVKEKDNHEEIKKGIDKIVEKNREVFEGHNTLFNLDEEYAAKEEITGEVIAFNEKALDLNMENPSPQINQNETIIVEINSEKVRENNLEVSKVKDVVLEVLENLRKADLDIFTELKNQAEDRAQKVGTEREKRGLLSGLEGMLEIKFGVVSLDLVPEMKKIDELDRLYEVKEKILATRDFTEVEKIVGVIKK